MQIPFFPKKKTTLGLDIGSSSVKLVELKETKKGFSLANLGIASLPPEAIVDGALMNAGVVSEAIKSILQNLKIKNKDVATAVSGHSVIIKKIMLPVMSEEELEESIQWEAEQYIPFDIKDVNLDFQILGPAETQGQMSVLLVAAKKDMINDYVNVLVECGLTPAVVDVAAFAVENAFGINYQVNEGEVVGLINIGASVTNMNILKGGNSTFTRDVSNGGNNFTEEIQKSQNLSFEEADKIKTGPKEGKSPEVESIIASVVDTVAGEVQRSLDFYANQAGSDKITKLYLSGGAAKTTGLEKAISEKSGLPCETINPLKNIEFSQKAFDAEYLNEVAPAMAVAVGLATRKPGD